MVTRPVLGGVMLGLLLSVYACGPRVGTRTASQAAGPAIAVEREIWEFGTIKRGETVTTRIGVTNEGIDTLAISLYSTCDCLTAVTDAARLGPGEGSSLSLTYIGDEIKDRVTKTLYIDSNDTLNPRITIQVTGTILAGDLPHMVVVPNPVAVQESAPEGPVALLTVSNKGKQALTIEAIRCFGCIHTWSGTELKGGEKSNFQIELLPGWHDKRWVEIESNDPVSPTRKVAIVELE
jgi:hypothetical protein